ncbi:MAG: hypothetical protein R2883_06165 [Caldisericia bacterium]
MASDPTPSSWFNNVLDGDTITTPFTILGEYKAEAKIDTIQVSPDGGETWLTAEVDKETREWSLHVAAPPGDSGVYHLISRATDKNGRMERTVNPNVDVNLRKKPVEAYIVRAGTGRE